MLKNDDKLTFMETNKPKETYIFMIKAQSVFMITNYNTILCFECKTNNNG